MTKLISGRVAKVGSANVSVDRYQFIGLSETEPDLGLPAVSGYVLSSDITGNRIWVDAASASGSPFFANTSGIANVALTANIANTVLTLSNFTTANLAEGINLYYTNARVLSFITPYLTTSNVAEGTNLYYTNARVYAAIQGNLATKANVADLTTSNVSELTNLYYTDARVYAAIAGNLAIKANVTDLTTANVSELTNLYYTNARVNAFVQPYLTTANVLESNSNLYYTNARVRSTLSGGTGVLYDTANGIISIGQNVSTTADVQFSNVKVTNIIATTGDVFIGGNLIPAENAVFNFGSPTNVWKDFYLSAESLFVGSTKVSSNTSTGGLRVTTAAGQATDFTAANIFAGNATVSGLIYGNLIGTVSSISNFSTSNLREGTNLYYTNARVISAVTPYLTTANVLESNSNLYYSNSRVYSNVIATLAGNIAIGNATVGNVIVSGTTTFGAGEGGSLTGANLLSATNIQANNLTSSTGNLIIAANIIPSLDSVFNFGSLDKQWKDFYLSAESLYVGGQKLSGNTETGLTVVNLTASNITTGNLVVTRSLIGNVTGTVSSLSNFTTSNLVEGTNQYFTNAKVTANLSQQSINVFADVDITGITTNGILTWNGTRFVAGTVEAGATANSAMVAYQADHANTADSSNVANSVLSLSGLTTANLLESNVNLYFTNTRARSAFIAGQNIIIEANGRISANVSLEIANLTATISNLTSDSITEGNQNLYYTNGRVITAVTPYLTTANVLETNSNLYYTNTRVLSAVLPYLTTSNVAEGTNLYYTNTRVRSALSGGTGVSYNESTGGISIGQNVASTANVTFYNVSVTNNLIVYGGVTTYGANNISVSDNMIYLNSNSTVSNPDIGFAFNYNDGVYRHGGFFRDASDNGTFKVFENYSPEPDANIFIDTADASFRLANIAAATFFGNVSGTAGTVSSLTNFTTANLAEGTNLYYTNARVNSNVIAFLPSLAGQNIIIEANGRISANVDTSNITVLQANVVALAAQVISLSNQTTSNIAEGSNLYYTNARVRTAFTPGRGITISESGIITNTGSSSQYNTGIDGTVGANVLSTMSPVLTFPTSSATDRYLLRSLHLVNTSDATALVSSNVLYATGNTAYLANAIPVVPGGVMEFIKTYQIFQPGDSINLQGFNTSGTATANLMSIMLTYETFYNDNSYMGTGQTIATSGTNTKIYDSANSFSVIESVKFVNLQSTTVPITCYWGDANGVPRAHLAFGLQLPPNTSVELLQATKRINQYDGLYASYTGGSTNGVSAFVSARYGSGYTIGSYTSTGLPGNTITASFGTTANEGTGLYYTIE